MLCSISFIALENVCLFFCYCFNQNAIWNGTHYLYIIMCTFSKALISTGYKGRLSHAERFKNLSQ